VDVSVIIPTRARPAKLAACLSGLARQRFDPVRFEVLVGFDGSDATGVDDAKHAWREAGGPDDSLRVIECERLGYNAARNALLPLARGRFMLSLDDDVLPEPQLVEVHAHEQRAAASTGRPAIITGYSPFRVRADDSLFDVLIRETSLIFFYHRMLTPRPRTPAPVHPVTPSRHDWGFRHCWGLNFSAPLEMVREIGGFTAIRGAYGYDDLELAWRLRERFGTPVLFRPEARADHDHRYAPREVLDREHRLGLAAWSFAGVSPAFCREVFRRDIRSDEELARSRALIARDADAAAGLERSFLALSGSPARDVCEDLSALARETYERHLPLKRWHWNQGLLHAAGPIAPQIRSSPPVECFGV
jgi:glycosyltransferase involved in cell wall biosynthesis